MACMLLGCLLKNTSLLNNPSYPLTKEDFAPCKFHQIIFVAINRLASDGGNDLTELEIDECIKVKKSAYNIFIENNGLEFISTIREALDAVTLGLYWNDITVTLCEVMLWLCYGCFISQERGYIMPAMPPRRE